MTTANGALWGKITRIAEGKFLRGGGWGPPGSRSARACPAAGALVARLVAKRVLRATSEDHTGRYHAVAGHVSVALETVLQAGPAPTDAR